MSPSLDSGVPSRFSWTRGRNFESKLFRAVCELLQIHRARTTPYPPSDNGQMERYNRYPMDAVQCFVDKEAHNCWDEHMAQISGAFRSAVNRKSVFNKPMLGRGQHSGRPSLPPPPSRRGNPVDLEAYVMDLEQVLQTAHEMARGRLHTSEERVKQYDYDLKFYSRAYKEGDLVYILETANVTGKCRKLSPSWKGTGIVIKKLSPYQGGCHMVANHYRL